MGSSVSLKVNPMASAIDLNSAVRLKSFLISHVNMSPIKTKKPTITINTVIYSGMIE